MAGSGVNPWVSEILHGRARREVKIQKREVNQILSKGLCGKKQMYPTEEDAITAVATKMKYGEKTADWRCFKVYRCKKCDGWHLTKNK